VIRGQAATSTKLGGDLDLNGNDITGTGSIPAVSAQKNLIINGNFDIWQRGTSFAAIADSTYHADRFQYSKGGTMVHTVSRSTDVPTVAESSYLSNYSVLIDCTTADASIAAGDLCLLQQRLEGYNWATLAQQAITLSFWHKHTKTGTYCVALRNSGVDRSYVAEYTQSVTDTWEKATINISASPSAGTWNYTTGIGVYLSWALASGTDYHGTADTWESANDLATSNQVNACDSTSNNFMIAQVQLEAGSVATDFEIRNHATERIMCERYYEQSYDDGVATGTTTDTGAIMFRSNGTSHMDTLHYTTEKRTAPTITLYSTSGGASGNMYDRTAAANKVSSASAIGTGRCRFEVVSSIDNNPYSGHYTINAEL
jgi:hypothetical protein